MAASATDNQIGVQLIDRVVAHTPTVSKAWVDAGFKDDVAIHGAVHGIDVEQVLRSDSRAGFVPIAKRWIVEQVNGTLMLSAVGNRDYVIVQACLLLLVTVFIVVNLAATANLVRRLSGTATATWRAT